MVYNIVIVLLRFSKLKINYIMVLMGIVSYLTVLAFVVLIFARALFTVRARYVL
jgi:hypothetical protein